MVLCMYDFAIIIKPIMLDSTKKSMPSGVSSSSTTPAIIPPFVFGIPDFKRVVQRFAERQPGVILGVFPLFHLHT